MHRNVPAAAVVILALMAVGCGGGGSTSTPAPTPTPVPTPTPTPTPDGPTVSVVLTSDDRVQLMAPQPAVYFSTGNGGSNTVFVDESRQFQEIEGFGAAFTDSAAYLLSRVAPPAVRDSAMNDLFTRNGHGIGLSFMRIPMGASDIVRSVYSYDDLPAGQTDPTLAGFSVAHDRDDIIPLIVQARQLNLDLKLMANPWSPPGWMKTSGSMIGGSLLPAMYAPFASYFVKFLQAYSAAGIAIDYISLQNEPEYVPADYPGMSMDAPTETAVLRDYVLPALAAAGISSKVLVYDHNWDDETYAHTVLSEPSIQGSAQVAGTAWHGYGGTPGAMTALRNEFPDKGNYETEHSGGTWIADQVKNDFEEITLVMRNWGRAYVKWSLALDENRGPHTGGCGTCSPVVTVNSGSGAISYFIDYYTLGHFSRFVLPGAHRVYSSNATGIVTAAFVNPDQSKALVAFNDTNAGRTFQVQWGRYALTYSLPALAGATFTWSGTQSGGYTADAGAQIQASSYDDIAGLETETSSDVTGGYDVGYATDGGYAVYRNVDFGGGFTTLSVRLACTGNCGGAIEFHLDSPAGALAGSVAIPSTGGWQNWQTVAAAASASAAGVHDLYLVFRAASSGSGGLGNVNWFQFGGRLAVSHAATACGAPSACSGPSPR
jgi:O-glycosyl hydrolase